MSPMTRKDFLAAVPLLTTGAPATTTRKTRHFDLSVDARRLRLTHLPAGIILADAPYSSTFDLRDAAITAPDNRTILREALLYGCVRFRQEIRVASDAPWIEERISLVNTGSQPAALHGARCGFVLPLQLRNGAVQGPWADFKAVAVPYRREPSGDRTQYADYSLADVLTKPRTSQLRARTSFARNGNVYYSRVVGAGVSQETSPEYASEGWCLTDGKRGYLITKYCPTAMEFAILDRCPVDAEHCGLRWGGFGAYFGDPEPGFWLAPGATHEFGVTRLTAFEGGVTEGFYTFRREMESRGAGCPKDFDAPSHWNEIYDNKLWWLPRDGPFLPENKRKYYGLQDMREEAAKARDIGCQALYLDPGWDTSFASKIWDEPRLGKLSDFTAMLKRDYGLSLSLHTPLSGWCDPTSYPRAADRMDRNGQRIANRLCGASRQYLDETLARFDALARDGATFFMFDGTIWQGECWDPSHGHPVPMRRHDLVEATNRLARLVHARHPKVLIEMHDQLMGGCDLRYVPTYLGYGNSGLDTVWAFELMWDPMRDLVGGHSIALYYYNLAYSIPLYIHIDLRKDNDQALMLWWNISTCRHLGLGGTHADPAARQAQKQAMSHYRRLKPYFARGIFYGIDEQTHLHRHPTESSAVINCFNLDDRPVTRHLDLDPTRFGLNPNRRYTYPKEVQVAPYGHTLVEVRPVEAALGQATKRSWSPPRPAGPRASSSAV